MATRSTPALDRVVVNLAISVDLGWYAESFGLVGKLSARDDLKQTVLHTVRTELERMGIPRTDVNQHR